MSPSQKESALTSFKFINYNRIGVFVFMFFLDLYLFFGAICNNYYGETAIDESLIWYYQLFFKVGLVKDVVVLQNIPILVIILVFIGFYLTYKEEIALKGVKFSLYFIPLTTMFSILWYWVNMEAISFTPFVLLFARIEGYVTMFLTFLLIMLGSYLGIKFKQYSLIKRKIIVKRNDMEVTD